MCIIIMLLPLLMYHCNAHAHDLIVLPTMLLPLPSRCFIMLQQFASVDISLSCLLMHHVSYTTAHYAAYHAAHNTAHYAAHHATHNTLLLLHNGGHINISLNCLVWLAA